MINQKLVASLKANGKILREFKDTVYIPFGSEYQIVLKNLNTVRCIVNVFVDGEDMAPGGLVLSAGQAIDLERSIKNGNLNEGNAFKFVERTAAIENGSRGIKLEDGLIRIEYQFEKILPQKPVIRSWLDDRIGSADDPYRYRSLRSMPVGYTLDSYSSSNVPTCSANDVGITVPGSINTQKFETTSWFPTESEKHSIVLKLLGETADNKPITSAITTKRKPKCVTCGKVNKGTAKFCQECGTFLTIVS